MTSAKGSTVDHRVNLRPPVLGLCFVVGLFLGMYVGDLQRIAKPPKPSVDAVDKGTGKDVPEEPPGPGPAPVQAVPPTPNPAPAIAQVTPTPPPPVEPRPEEPAVVLEGMPPEPPVALDAQVGLTGRNADPPQPAADGSAKAANALDPAVRERPKVDFEGLSPY